MNPEQWRQFDRIFHEALDREPVERARFIEEACAGDVSLRKEVEALIGSHERAGSFLESVAAEAVSSRRVSIAAGTRFGPYEILGAIGAGGMGEVYKAHDARLRRDVAVKVLHQVVPDGAAWERFQLEARAASALSHPNICTVYDVGEADGQPYLVMELLEGVTLSAHVGDRPLEAGASMAIAAQIADALEAAHAKGIHHRDIKPANVMITSRGYVKVLDFGLAKQNAIDENHEPLRQDVVSIAGTVTGTPPYLSPEVLQGACADARSDLWAFGVLLYQMLTGRLPFTGATVFEIASAILTEPAPPLPWSVPAGLRAIVERCLAKRPEERYQNAGEVRSALEVLRTRAAPAGGISRRTWLWAAGAAAVLLPSAAGTLWRLWQKDYFWVNPLEGVTFEGLTDFPSDAGASAISPDGKLAAYVSNRDGQTDVFVRQIDSDVEVSVTKGKYVLITSRDNRGVGFSNDGQRVWFRPDMRVSFRPDMPPLTVFWVSALGGEDPRPLREGAMNLAWSPTDGRMVYHTNEVGDPIYIADGDGSNPQKVFEDKSGVHCHFPIWSPNGNYIYFVKGLLPTDEWDIWRVEAPPKGVDATVHPDPVRITSQHTRISHLDWLDSSTLIYSAMAEDSSAQWLYAMDVEKRIQHRVSPAGFAEQFLSVAVSAKQRRRLLVTVARPEASLRILSVSDVQSNLPLQTWAEVSFFSVPKRALAPRFAPMSSGYLLFLSSKGGGDGLWKLENGATAAWELWPGVDGGVVAPPAISQDGRQICFPYRKQGRTRLRVMNADGKNSRDLANLAVAGACSWSPSGKWVAVAGNNGEGTRVFKVPVDGGDPIALLDTFSFDPLWSPDDTFILYSEQPEARETKLKAIKPDGAPVASPKISLYGEYPGIAFRFMPGGKALVTLASDRKTLRQEFVWFDLETEQKRTLAQLDQRSGVRNFDVSADGKRIIFDHVQNNADIVVMNLP